MKISAIVPLYNGEKYILDTLKHLERQIYPLHEIIVVNDCSTDRSAEIVDTFIANSRIKTSHIINDRNSGVSYSRNRGIRESSGEAILFMDADDLAHNRLTQSHVELWENVQFRQRWVLSHSAFQQMNEQGEVLEGVFRFKQVSPEEILGYEIVRNYVYLSGTIVDKEAILAVGGFDEKLTHCEDWDLWLRLAVRGGFLYHDDPLVLIRRHNNNASSTIESVTAGERRVLEKYDASFLQEAISKRKLPEEKNIVDYVSVMYRLERWELGYDMISKLLNIQPDSISGYLFKGMYEVHQREFKKAILTFQKALAIDSKRCEILNNLGACYLSLKNSAEAKKYLFRASELLPNYMDANKNLLIINANTGETPHFTWRELRPVLLTYS
ncbi:glycosyltransferase family A protein [Cohnella cholangitidis]|uniref:Glycosyltransferase n=1 Tax=Cohnella cholangitidis TaxID=2598458 RepID=A0A7G5BXI7_9BACL|nr:glycosyltransferase family A protein [Cohnella cholangitidis]QMV41671.1 glycosyltransferase [Cohnella cholangitidis]